MLQLASNPRGNEIQPNKQNFTYFTLVSILSE